MTGDALLALVDLFVDSVAAGVVRGLAQQRPRRRRRRRRGPCGCYVDDHGRAIAPLCGRVGHKRGDARRTPRAQP
jgi:hypothetical protein